MNGLNQGVVIAGLSLLACSARYEVGVLENLDESGGTGGALSSGGTAMTAGGSSAGGSPPLDAPLPEPVCSAVGSPPPLTGDFVAPSRVWARVAPFIWGETHSPPSELPEFTSYGWSGELVSEAFAEAEAEGSMPGGDWFVRRWLGLDEEDVLLGEYETSLLREDLGALEVLLLSSWDEGRSGVFSEKAWLETFTSIPQRGGAMAGLLFGVAIPAPPPEIPMTVDPTLPDREAMEVATSVTPPCNGCHVIINELGFALGNFDRAGDYRTLDRGKPIDTSGRFQANWQLFEFDGIADLGMQAAGSCDAARGLVRSMLEIALNRLDYDQATLDAGLQEEHIDRVTRAFIAGGRSYRALVQAYAQSPLVLY